MIEKLGPPISLNHYENLLNTVDCLEEIDQVPWLTLVLNLISRDSLILAYTQGTYEAIEQEIQTYMALRHKIRDRLTHVRKQLNSQSLASKSAIQ